MEPNYVTIKYPSYEEWRKGHQKFLGGASASVILGVNKYKNLLQLYSEITTPNLKVDETKNEVLTFGIESEPLIRKTFALNYPEYEVIDPNGYESYVRKDKTFLGASLDGILIKKSTGDKYVLEIKTADIRNRETYQEWNGQIPQSYFCQVLHYLMVMTDCKGVKLVAQLRYFDFSNEASDKVEKLETRFYHIEREEVENDIAYLEKLETEFWENNVVKRTPPNLIIKATEDK